MDPIVLRAFFTARDDSLIQLEQLLDVERVDASVPRLRIASTDLFVRSSFNDVPEKLLQYLPSNDQHIFSVCELAFPVEQKDVIGGGLEFTLLEAEGKGALGFAPSSADASSLISVADDKILLLGSETATGPVVAADLMGNRTCHLTLKFRPSTAVSPEAVNAILRSVVWVNDRKRPTVKAQQKPITMHRCKSM